MKEPNFNHLLTNILPLCPMPPQPTDHDMTNPGKLRSGMVITWLPARTFGEGSRRTRVFNTPEVPKERAKLAALNDGLTYERNPELRQPYALKSSMFLNSLTDTLSKKLVRTVFNRYGVAIWPWDRAGFQRRLGAN